MADLSQHKKAIIAAQVNRCSIISIAERTGRTMAALGQVKVVDIALAQTKRLREKGCSGSSLMDGSAQEGERVIELDPTHLVMLVPLHSTQRVHRNLALQLTVELAMANTQQ